MASFDKVIVAKVKHGQKKDGVESGGDILLPIVQEKFGNIDYVSFNPSYASMTEIGWQSDYRLLSEILKQQPKYILLGGDHSIGQSSVAASIGKVDDINNLYVIWIDAHADLNTYEASKTKNYHGMPLAGIVGYEDSWFDIKSKLPTTNLLYFGIRDLDDFEVEQIEKDEIFHTLRLSEMIDKVKEILATNPSAKFHISWDVDSIDPFFLDSTGCLAGGGLTPTDVHHLLAMVLPHSIAFDIVEFNPSLGDLDKSISTMREIICSL